MLCGIQASLSNNQETWNPFKEEHVTLFLGIHMNHALGTCQFDFLFERRENHCHRFAEGLPNNERTKSLLPPSRFECHGRSLRNSANILQIPGRMKRFENSPIPCFIKILNKQFLFTFICPF